MREGAVCYLEKARLEEARKAFEVATNSAPDHFPVSPSYPPRPHRLADADQKTSVLRQVRRLTA